MKNCKDLDTPTTDNRKAYIEKQNRLIQEKQKTPEPSVLGCSIFSLNSLSLQSENEDFPYNYTSRSKKPSEIYYECISSKFSEKDQKILRLMALRREEKMRESEKAFAAKNVWESERLQLAMKAEEKRTSLAEYLTKKKQMEDLEILIRKNYRNEKLKREKTLLEMKILEKHAKAEQRHKQLSLQKKHIPESSSIDYQLQLHQEIKREREKEKELETVLHKFQFEAKTKQSEEKLKSISMERRRKLKEESLRQTQKWLNAKTARDELNKKSEEEQIRHLKYLEKTENLRNERVNWTKEWKRKLTWEKNEKEKLQHAIMYNKIKEEEKEKLSRTKHRIQAKDLKMKILKEKRQETISKSRFNARISAELRNKMRQTYEL